MPKVVKRPITPVGWAILVCFTAAILYAFAEKPIVVGGLIGLIFVSSLIQNFRARRHLQRLASNRGGESICTFVREADCRNVDTWVVRAVYEQLQEHLSSAYPTFPLRWNDRLKEDLKIDEEDLEVDLASEVAERAGRDYRDTKGNPYFGKVRTVGDLVLFFNAQTYVTQI